MPAAASFSTRCVRSALIAAATALPSRIVAVIADILPRRRGRVFVGEPKRPRSVMVCPLVIEVPDPGEVESGSGLLRCDDRKLVADGTARLGYCSHPGLEQHLQRVGEREI